MEDLVPRKDPKGGKAGSGKAVFGGGPVISGPDGEDRRAKKGRREKSSAKAQEKNINSG